MHIAAIIAWMKGLALVSKLLSLAGPLAGLLPGGQIVLAITSAGGAVMKAAGRVIKWAWGGVVVCFSHPTAFIVCVAFMLFGAWSYGHYHRDVIAGLRADLAQLQRERDAAVRERDGWRDRHGQEEKRAKEAEDARAAAEDARKKLADDRSRAAEQPSPAGLRSPAAPRRPGAGNRSTEPAEFGLLKGLFAYPAGPGR